MEHEELNDALHELNVYVESLYSADAKKMSYNGFDTVQNIKCLITMHKHLYALNLDLNATHRDAYEAGFDLGKSDGKKAINDKFIEIEKLKKMIDKLAKK